MPSLMRPAAFILMVVSVAGCSPAIDHGAYVRDYGRAISTLATDTYKGMTGLVLGGDETPTPPPQQAQRPPAAPPEQQAQPRSAAPENATANAPSNAPSSKAPVKTMASLPPAPKQTYDVSPLALYELRDKQRIALAAQKKKQVSRKAKREQPKRNARKAGLIGLQKPAKTTAASFAAAKPAPASPPKPTTDSLTAQLMRDIAKKRDDSNDSAPIFQPTQP